ncbi:MAG: hypothetical protein M3Z20_12140 [Chloroflexota bacterium]|nr:hypothetical protein [Chloroflexota bacterium]
METDPFDSLRVRLANAVTRRRSLGILGLLGMATMALPDEATARKKRKKKKKNRKKNKGQTSTTPAPTTASTTTRAPGTCGAAGSFCGTEQTPCICAASSTDVRCVSLEDLELDLCEHHSDCTGGKICILEPFDQTTLFCLSPCHL